MEKRGKNYKYKIEGRDLDFSRRPSIMALSDYILRAAGEDADQKGFGIRELNRGNCSWVLSRMAVEIDTMPEQYEQITVYTWVGDISRLMTTRNFIIYNEQGAQIGAATTLWAMIDLDSRQPMDLRSHTEYNSAIVNEPQPIESTKRIIMPQATDKATHKVAYSDIDFNQHANSIKYLEWLVDMLPIEWHTERTFNRYDINFMHESLYGETLQIGCYIDQNATFEITNTEGVAICRASIHFKQ